MKISLIVAVSLLICISCDPQVEIKNENITGTWNVSEFKSEIPNVPEEYQKAGESEFLSSIYTLNDDNSMKMHSEYFTEGAAGRWEFDPATKEISMAYSYDTIEGIEVYNIEYLSKNKMVWHQKVEANEFNGFVELTLEK